MAEFSKTTMARYTHQKHIIDRYIVMTARECMPTSCWGEYRKIAVVETDGIHLPKQIHPRHKSVVRIVERWNKLFCGISKRCAYAIALAEAESLCDELNAKESN
jgi:hypothetical protein